jgi:Fe2+ or Zn2+ uptake regulation protein
MSDIDTYKGALKEARSSFNTSTQRLQKIEAEAEELRLKLTRLRRTITALAAQCSESPSIDALGITESCLEVMESTQYKMSTTDVVKGLEEMGFDLASQKNAAASVHAILTRLAEKERIKKIAGYDAKSVMWSGPKFDPSIYEISDDDIPF